MKPTRARTGLVLVTSVGLLLAGCTSSSAAHSVSPSAHRATSSSLAAPSSSLARSQASAIGGTSSAAKTAPLQAPMPTAGGGELLSRVIPGASSGFVARPAIIYVPPAAVRDPALQLPMLELMHGTIGGPTDWAEKGNAVAIADAFAAKHDGQSPIIVMPDINGSHAADTECVHAAVGDVERYLTYDVPHYMRSHFHILASRQDSWLAGLSEGGTCAIMLALRHPDVYSAFGDFSGLTRVTVGDQDDPSLTIAQLFGGSMLAFEQHEPLYLLAHNRYPTLRGWFESGADDPLSDAAQRSLAAASSAAGITVHTALLSGSHSWGVWATSLTQLLPWLWAGTTR